MVPGFTIDEVICACISRQVKDGDLVAQGLATPLVAAGYLLAWRTHAPSIHFASAIGQSVCREGGAIGLGYVEDLWLDKALMRFGFIQGVSDLLPRLLPKEFFRPGQVDPAGNFNNIGFGSDYRRPRLRMPGSGGIPDVTTMLPEIYLYVPQHSRVTFVNELDFISGLGHSPKRVRGGGPCYLVSDLGQFDFVNGRMRLTHLHPGVPLAGVLAKTGFKLEVSEVLAETEPPSAEALRLLRDEIDPLGIRRLELLRGAARRETLREIIQREQTLHRQREHL